MPQLTAWRLFPSHSTEPGSLNELRRQRSESRRLGWLEFVRQKTAKEGAAQRERGSASKICKRVLSNL